MKTKSKGKGGQLHIRLTEEEERILDKLVEKRGTNKTSYIKEKLFADESKNICNQEVEKSLYEISDLLVNVVPKNCGDEKINSECRKVVERLWRSLR